MEIERKYLVRFLPDGLEDCQRHELEQGYIGSSPTIRIRREDNRYVLTIKEHRRPQVGDNVAAPIVNREEEFYLTVESYAHLRTKCDGNFIVKTRYRIPLNTEEGRGEPLVAELDLFHGALEGFALVEVEVPTVEASCRFVPPEWFGTDVSQDKRYRNSHLRNVSPAEAAMLVAKD